MRWGLAAGAGALICLGLIALALQITHPAHGLSYFIRGRASSSFFVAMNVVIASVVGPVSGILIRDWLLRKRVRHILRARGTCVGCGYGLVGLPVSQNHQITCPECELLCEVDPSLGELSTNNGVETFQPSGNHLQYGWWTPKRAARLGLIWRITWRATLIGLPLGWGCYEVFLILQANRAAAEKPNAAGILALVESRQPVPLNATTRNDPDGWAMLELAFARLQELESAHAPNPMPAVNTRPVIIDYSLIEIDNISQRFETDAEYQNACRTVSLAMMEHFQPGGLFSQLDALAQYQRAVRPISLTATSPAINITIPSLGQARRLSRINLARMHLALQASDEKGFIAACESNLAIARFLSYQPSIIDVIVALAIENITLRRLIMGLSATPSAGLVADAKRALEKQKVTRTSDYPWDGEYTFTLDTICWVFADTSNTRFGRFSPSLMKFTQGSLHGKLGTFAGNKNELQELFSQTAQYANVLRANRAAVPTLMAGNTDYLLISLLAPSSFRVIEGKDESQLLRDSLSLMIALEEFRIASAKYPSTLSELVPTHLKSLPLDPCSGSPIGYKLIDASSDPFKRPYILYSVGHDQVDDGGIARNDPKPFSGQMHYNLFDGTYQHPDGTGDFVINFPS